MSHHFVLWDAMKAWRGCCPSIQEHAHIEVQIHTHTHTRTQSCTHSHLLVLKMPPQCVGPYVDVLHTFYLVFYFFKFLHPEFGS